MLLPGFLHFFCPFLQRDHVGVELRLTLRFSLGQPASLELFVLFVGRAVGFFARDATGIGQHLALIEAQEVIELGFPILHEDLTTAAGLVFRVVEEHVHDAV